MRIVVWFILLHFSFMTNADAIGVKQSDYKYYVVPAENNAFRGITVSGTNGEYVVTGEARPAEGMFYYSVEDGHMQYIKERQVILKGKCGGWELITVDIRVSNDVLPHNGTLMLNLYERSKDGRITNSYPVILERF